MAKVQDQNGSIVASFPPMVAKLIGIKPGDFVDYEYNKKTGRVEIIKVEKGDKK